MEDEVDRLVGAWRRELPGLDVSPLEVLSRVARLARHVERVRGEVFARHGLDEARFDVLAALRRAGLPYQLSPGQLGVVTMAPSGTVTSRVDRLEVAELVQRREDPSDGRGRLVRLTPTGRRTVDAALADLVAREQAILHGLSERQRATLAGLLRRLVAPFDVP